MISLMRITTLTPMDLERPLGTILRTSVYTINTPMAARMNPPEKDHEEKRLGAIFGTMNVIQDEMMSRIDMRIQ
jgi:hypothetical protein